MTLEDKLERELEELGGTIMPNEKLIDAVMSRIEEQDSTKQRGQVLLIRRIIMNRFSKLTAAAAIITGLVIWAQMEGPVIPKAYALQQSLDAYNSILWLHVKASTDGRYGNSDTWLQYDKYGNIVNMRFQTPYLGDSVGSFVLVSNSEESEAWLARFNLHITGYGRTDPIFGFDVSTVEPRNLIERLRQQQEQGEIILDINEPSQKNEPIVVTVTYPEEHPSHEYMKVLYIDQATKLVTGIEKYKLKDGEYQHEKTLEFFDYNQEIDPMMFSLAGDVSSNANVIEMPEEAEVGLPQGDMTDEEITSEVIRQFFEAVIAKDYDKAGLLYMCAPGFLVEQTFMGANVIEITEIGQPYPDPDPDSDAMFCSCKAIAEFDGQYYELDNKWMKVQRIGQKPYRWLLAGNTTSVNPAPGKVIISKDNVNLDAVTYYNPEPGEFMKKWLVLGWLPYYSREDIDVFSKEGQQYSFDIDKLDFLNFTPSVNIDGKDYDWAVLEAEYNTVDLTQINNEKNDFQLAYLWAQIDMPEETKGTLGIGSDDGVKVWLNGKLLYEKWLYRGVVVDNDKVPVTFKKGKNQLVLKVQNAMGPWGFCCRLLEE
jgi:hypothetical protein